MKIKLFATAALCISLLNSCKTDLDILAPYKSIPVIYGILNHTDPVHYIRVQKAFLGAGDAYNFSAVPDSNYFTDITVKLIPFKVKDNGDTLFKIPKEIILTDTIINTKEDGEFFSPSQKLYKTSAKLDSTFSVILEVTNNESGIKYKSFTPLVDNVKFNTPNANIQSFVFFATQLGDYNTYNTQWNIGNNGYYTELFLVFNYRSVYSVNGQLDTIAKVITWKQAPIIKDQTSTVETAIPGEEFYKYLKERLPSNGDTLARIFDNVNFIADVAGLEYYNYLTLNQPATTIVQDKPVYGNISGGYGIFSTRARGKSALKKFTAGAKKELVDGQYTQQLNFND